MKKSLFTAVLLAAGVAFASAQTADTTKAPKKTMPVETGVEVKVDSAAVLTPAEIEERRKAEQEAMQQETAAEIKAENEVQLDKPIK
ncbi:MAG: hypothetical protein K0M56_09725 [Kaistella sp.]|nr:hypothetical protein [Kaistella sp.]